MAALREVKLANSIRLNKVENTYFNNDKTNITLDGLIVTLTDRRSGNVQCTSLMNCISFNLLELKNEKTEKKEDVAETKARQIINKL